MATVIEVALPKLDATESVEVGIVEPKTIDTDMEIKDALKNKNNSLAIVVVATRGGNLTIKAGDNYPNAMLGDLAVNCAAGTTVIRLQDIARFENRDCTVKVAGDGTLAGTIYATAKRAGIRPAADM